MRLERRIDDNVFRDYRGKYVVLFFYPLDFTFVCPTEIIAFSEAAADFAKGRFVSQNRINPIIHFSKELDTKIIAASTDSNFSHLAWINTDRYVASL